MKHQLAEQGLPEEHGWGGSGRGPVPRAAGGPSPSPLTGDALQPAVIYVALVQLMRFVPGDS